ncbi:hypothetical protein M2158_007636 [Streptomyces sp. SAI-144]|nr:hypothetical protein [Streptomyces sp. SAI-144]
MGLTIRDTGRHPGETADKRNSACIRHPWKTALTALGIRTPEKARAEQGTKGPAVSDPEIPRRTPAPNSSSRTDSGGYAVALECVRLVIAWYNSAIYDEEHAPSPDAGRLDRLIAERRECVIARKSLAQAGPEEIRSVARKYGKRFRELTGVS